MIFVFLLLLFSYSLCYDYKLQTDCNLRFVNRTIYDSLWFGSMDHNCSIVPRGIYADMYPFVNSQVLSVSYNVTQFDVNTTEIRNVKVFYQILVSPRGFDLEIMSLNLSLSSEVFSISRKPLYIGINNVEKEFKLTNPLVIGSSIDIETNITIGNAQADTRVTIGNFFVEIDVHPVEIPTSETMDTITTETTIETETTINTETTISTETTIETETTISTETTFETRTTVETIESTEITETKGTDNGQILEITILTTVLCFVVLVMTISFILTTKVHEPVDNDSIEVIDLDKDIFNSKIYNGKYVLVSDSKVSCSYSNFSQLRNENISTIVDFTYKRETLLDQIIVINEGVGTINDYIETDLFDISTKHEMIIQLVSGIKYMLTLKDPIIHTRLTSKVLYLSYNLGKYSIKIGGYEYVTDKYVIYNYNTLDNYTYLPLETLVGKTYDSNSLIWVMCVCIWVILNMKEPWNGLSETSYTNLCKNGCVLYFDTKYLQEKYSDFLSYVFDNDSLKRPRIDMIDHELSSLLIKE